jgi:transcriptional regulator with XRE-family HTH domain
MDHPREICPAGSSFSGAQLAAARKANGLSLWRFSTLLVKAGEMVSPATLRTWELGIAEPRVTTFFKMARILRRLPHSFFRPNQETQPPAPRGGAHGPK